VCDTRAAPACTATPPTSPHASMHESERHYTSSSMPLTPISYEVIMSPSCDPSRRSHNVPGPKATIPSCPVQTLLLRSINASVSGGSNSRNGEPLPLLLSCLIRTFTLPVQATLLFRRRRKCSSLIFALGRSCSPYSRWS
jgi:hypothetical protein